MALSVNARQGSVGAPWRLYLAAALAGLLAGLVGAAFHALLDQAGRLRSDAQGLLDGAPVPGWLVLMGLGALTLVGAGWLVRRFAPETAGSGIQEVEAILAGDRRLRWWRVLPVKFFGGVLAVGSGLVLGREGPTVHTGAALGQMAAEGLRLDQRQQRSLVAAGAGAGLAAAFNAPLAAIVFVIEELREHFEYGFASVQSVILASCVAVAVSGWLLGQGPVLPVPAVAIPPVWALPLFVLLGIAIGALGVVFNAMLLGSVRLFKGLRGRYGLLPTALSGMALGALVWFLPQTVGGGESLVESLIHQPLPLLALVLLLALRLLTTVGSYGQGLPGGIFAPLLALGTIAGAAFDVLMQGLDPGSVLSPGLFAVAAMGALFAATVRAPLTGIILAIELTGAGDLVLPVILTCLTATFAAEALGGRPIYSLLLAESERAVPFGRPSRGRLLVAGALVAALLVAAPLTDLRAPVESTGPAMAGADPESRTAHEPTPGPDSGPAEPSPSPSPGPAEVASPEAAPRTEDRPRSIPPLGDAPGTREMAPPVVSAPAPPQPSLVTPAEEVATTPTADPPDAVADGPSGPRYVIQLASFRGLAQLRTAARRDAILEHAGTLEPSRGWYPLVFGDYGTRAEAEAALADLPEGLKVHRPFVRRLADGVRPQPLH